MIEIISLHYLPSWPAVRQNSRLRDNNLPTYSIWGKYPESVFDNYLNALQENFVIFTGKNICLTFVIVANLIKCGLCRTCVRCRLRICTTYLRGKTYYTAMFIGHIFLYFSTKTGSPPVRFIGRYWAQHIFYFVD